MAGHQKYISHFIEKLGNIATKSENKFGKKYLELKSVQGLQLREFPIRQVGVFAENSTVIKFISQNHRTVFSFYQCCQVSTWKNLMQQSFPRKGELHHWMRFV